MNRANIVIRNKTSYFDPNTDRVNFELVNPSSFRFRSNKVDSYEIRLYYEYLNCERSGGKVFFYTLTYNNKSLPKYEGVPCFDYNDLVDLLTGGFRKKLIRSYGYSFKYFIGAELGEGAGKRGLESNPHYHVLFFLYPESPDACISSVEFRSLVKFYWQGFDDSVCYRPFKYAKYGIAKEGDNLGLVTDYRACLYCAKYVVKDVGLKKFESKIYGIVFNRYFKSLYNDMLVRNNFFCDVVFPRYGKQFDDIPDNDEFYFYVSDIFEYLTPRLFSIVHDLVPRHYLDFFDSFIKESNLETDFNKYVFSIVKELVDVEMNTFRNRYSNKCRISQGVGDYALDFVDDNFKVPIPSSKGFKCKPLSMYYYRKLFYDVQKNGFGDNIYVLNSAGVDYKVSRLERVYNKLFSRVRSLFDSITLDLVQLVNMDTDNSYNFCDIIISDDVVKRYCLYKIIYEGRFYDKYDIVPEIQPSVDYRTFLNPSFYTVDFSPDSVKDFFDSGCDGFLSYSQHPYFADYLEYFSLIDSFLSVVFVHSDKRIEDNFLEIKRVKSFHDKLKLKFYYSNF